MSITNKKIQIKNKKASELKLTEICEVCGLATTDEASGSITSWMFRSKHCTCTFSRRAQDNEDGQILPKKVDISAEYETLEELGSGGMGSVYKVRNKLGTDFALKVLRTELATDPIAVERFRQEIKAVERLSNPHLASVFDSGTDKEGRPFFVMEFIEGMSLAKDLEKKSPLPLERLLEISVQICDALAYAHESGIIHRDLKPSNVLLKCTADDTDFVKLVDFGIAKIVPPPGKDTMSLTKTGEIFGSPQFMSPEQCQGERLDRRSDIYSIGCLMYQCLTGKPPFDSPNPVKIILGHIYEHPLPLRIAAPSALIPEDVQEVILACLQKDPNNRYQSVEELRDDLKILLEKRKPKLPASARASARAKDARFAPMKYSPVALLLCVIVMLGLAIYDLPSALTYFGAIKFNKTFGAAHNLPANWIKDDYNDPFGLMMLASHKLQTGERAEARRNAGLAKELLKKRSDVRDELYADLLILQSYYEEQQFDKGNQILNEMFDQYSQVLEAKPAKGARVIGWWYFPPEDPENSMLAAGKLVEKHQGNQATTFYRRLKEGFQTAPVADRQRMMARMALYLYKAGKADEARAFCSELIRDCNENCKIGESEELDLLLKQCAQSGASELGSALTKFQPHPHRTLNDNLNWAINLLGNTFVGITFVLVISIPLIAIIGLSYRIWKAKKTS